MHLLVITGLKEYPAMFCAYRKCIGGLKLTQTLDNKFINSNFSQKYWRRKVAIDLKSIKNVKKLKYEFSCPVHFLIF